MAEALVTPENAAALDKAAYAANGEYAAWDLSPFALVEKAGQSCAAALEEELKSGENPSCLDGPILVCAGSGNNGADALVLLKSLLASRRSETVTKENKSFNAVALLNRFPSSGENNPRSAAVKVLQEMNVPVVTWTSREQTAELFHNARLIIDGIAGTGIQGALEGIPLEMADAINAEKCYVAAIDVPSGGGSAWQPGFPVVRSDCTLAVEPKKTVLYTPALRPYCGKIIPVRGIFPPELLKKYKDAELLKWETCNSTIPPVLPDAYKYSRGVCEIHAGRIGTAGAARLAAAGASAAGAGMIRLVLDDQLYPILAPAFGGIMAVPMSVYSAEKKESNRFVPDCILVGPGWGRVKDRLPMLQQVLEAEAAGTPLVLDADGIFLLKMLFPDIMEEGQDKHIFHGRTILTPHAGELAMLSGIPKEKLLSDPALVAEIAQKINAVILFKSHVMVIASPDGRLGFIDGMEPSLGAGGSGDVLAGLCAGIAGRVRAGEMQGKDLFDPYAAASASGALLVAAARRKGRRFYDPLELAEPAAALAGHAWLPKTGSFVKGFNNG